MKINLLGTGIVAQTIASRLHDIGHEIYLGTRNPEETISRELKIDPGTIIGDWIKSNEGLWIKSYNELPADADLVINATNGQGTLEALEAVGSQILSGKTLLDISNPLDFSNGMPPTLSVCNDNSLAEEIQSRFPDANVVKSLNTMNCQLMMDPSLLKSDHVVFVSGNDDSAKQLVSSLLQEVGWRPENILDLGDITSARGTEMILPVWLRIWGALGTAEFNFNIVKQ